MTEYIKQNCPLCSTPAEYCWVDAHNRKYYHCPACTYFIVSRRAEALLADAGQHVRDTYAAQAKQAPEEQLFVILIPPPQPPHEGPNPGLADSFVPKSQMHL